MLVVPAFATWTMVTVEQRIAWFSFNIVDMLQMALIAGATLIDLLDAPLAAKLSLRQEFSAVDDGADPALHREFSTTDPYLSH